MASRTELKTATQCVVLIAAYLLGIAGCTLFVLAIGWYYGNDAMQLREKVLAFACWACITSDAIEYWVNWFYREE